MDAIGLKKAIIAGHSMGGMIAMRLSLENPERVLALILIGTSAKVVDSFAMWFNTALARFLLFVAYPKAFRMILGRAFSEKFPEDLKWKLIDQWYKENDKYVVRNSFSNFVKHFDVREESSKISVPTLVIVGDKDVMLPPRMSEYIHKRIQGSELVILDGGHEIMLENPEGVNEAIENFLRKRGLIS